MGSSVADGSGLGVAVGGGGVAVGGIAVGTSVAGAEVGRSAVAGNAVGQGVEEGALVTAAVGTTVVGIAVAGGFVGPTAVATGAGLALGGSGVLLASGFGAITDAVAVGALRTGVAVGPDVRTGAPVADGGCATMAVGTIVTFAARVMVAIGTSVTSAGCLAPASTLADSGPPIPCARSKAISGSVESASETISCSSILTGLE